MPEGLWAVYGIGYAGLLDLSSFMKRLFLPVILLLGIIYESHGQKYSFQNLLGYWESNDGGALEAKDSSKLYLFYQGQKKPILSYTADFSKTPCWFDFVIKEEDSTVTLKSLLLFIDNNLLQWQVFEDGVHPANFSTDKGDIVYMKRKKNP